MLQDPLSSISKSQTITIMNLLFWSLLSYLGTTNYFKLHWAWQVSRKHFLSLNYIWAFMKSDCLIVLCTVQGSKHT